MITKHLKTLYLFFLERKITTFFMIVFFLILSAIDATIIYLGSYELFYFIKNSKLSDISTILIYFISIKIIITVGGFFYDKYRFSEIFIKNVQKFFTTLPYNKELFGKSQQAENMLKFQWEMNIIANETNNSYSGIIFTFVTALTNLAFMLIFVIFSHSTKDYLTLLTTVSFICIIYALQHFQTKLDNISLSKIDKKFSECNQNTFQYLSENSIKKPTDDYISLVANLMVGIKKLLMNIFIKKTAFEIMPVLLKVIYPITIILLQFNIIKSINSSFNPSEIISYITYNILFAIFTIKLIKSLADRNIFNLIAQNNIAIINKNHTAENNVSNSIVLETFEFKNVILKSEKNVIYDLNFKTKIKDNICFVSNSDNISLIRQFFEKKATKANGEILINGFELDKFSSETLENIIVTISTDVLIKNDTIKRNILPETSQISDEIVVKACKLSGFYEYIVASPLGYYTQFTNETELSLLERFQLSLTRALLSDGYVIIVDFSNFDENNPKVKEIKNMLITSLIDRILIIITNDTYQLDTVKNIAIIDNNRVVGVGSHEELIKNSDAYSSFFLKNYKNVAFAE